MHALRVHAEIERIDDILHNLAERKRHNREVVALQPEHRDADQEAEEGRHCRADQYGEHKIETARELTRHQIRKERGAEGTDTHETGVSEGQFARNADHQIQADRENRIGAERHQQTLEEGAHRAAVYHQLHNHKGENHKAVGDAVVYKCFLFRCSVHITPSLSSVSRVCRWAAPPEPE